MILILLLPLQSVLVLVGILVKDVTTTGSIENSSSPGIVVANVLGCDTVVSEFQLQSRYYVVFRTDTFGNGMKSCILQLWV